MKWIVRMRGGIGNQLFILAYAYKQVRNDVQTEIILDTREYKKYKIRDFELLRLMNDSRIKLLSEKENTFFYDLTREFFHFCQRLIKRETNSICFLSCFGLYYGRRKANCYWQYLVFGYRLENIYLSFQEYLKRLGQLEIAWVESDNHFKSQAFISRYKNVSNPNYYIFIVNKRNNNISPLSVSIAEILNGLQKCYDWFCNTKYKLNKSYNFTKSDLVNLVNTNISVLHDLNKLLRGKIIFNSSNTQLNKEAELLIQDMRIEPERICKHTYNMYI